MDFNKNKTVASGSKDLMWTGLAGTIAAFILPDNANLYWVGMLTAVLSGAIVAIKNILKNWTFPALESKYPWSVEFTKIIRKAL